MQSSISQLLALFMIIAATNAFTAPAFARPATFASAPSTTQVFAEPEEEEEEGGFDLDLGEMFEIFDAADKGEDFDKTVKKVKKGDK
jgi:hypothetical protein